MSNQFRLMVKFKPESVVSVKEGKINFSNKEEVIKTANYIFNFSYRHVIHFLSDTGECINTQNGIDFSQYKGLVYVENTEGMSEGDLELLAESFQALPYVEYAYVENIMPIAPPSVESHVDLIADTGGDNNFTENEPPDISEFSNTPDFINRQDYLRGQGPQGQIGIEADYAWRLNVLGQGIRCADIEWSFNFNHEDLVGPNFIPVLPTTNTRFNDHGAAVASVIMARNNGFGLLGANYGLDAFYGVSELTRGRVNGIAEGLLRLRAGDVFLYEMQTGGRLVTRPNGVTEPELITPDFDRGVWDITRTATNAGVIVIATAGNGAGDLDHPYYNAFRNRGDNGIIRLGAGTRIGRHRASFSTFGSPIHVQGWGDWSVTSAGYGALFNAGPNRNYTHTFSGTSAAGPIVAAAAIAIQSWYKARFQRVLAPRAMRDLLISTGTPQGTGGHIGPLPNIRRAIAALNVTPTYPLWRRGVVYVAGNRVSWNNNNWQASWWTQNVEPGTREPNGGFPWRQLSAANASEVPPLSDDAML
ncbi:S8 family serine peptidase [Acerihabitans sp. TG2]|uniref:S8 family peptidase n=1 Tax=Acerihabitans sp. TG2 TaxID=3096008 RepID=UPI002B227025|nr:S8 family serine peptidase [Acerihabitans sp. TG2]MEA9392547.1 S8 family serine peptidase [Acerihabitans sp. TG2]